MDRRHGLDGDIEQPLVVVHPLYALWLDVRVQHGVVTRQLLNGHGKVEITNCQPSIPQQGEPRVADWRLRWSQLLLLTADVVEGEE